jgi:UDPglucose 6-dehydrogenase
MNITLVGSGYVGMSLAVLLAQENNVCVLDIDKERVAKINTSQSTVEDTYIDLFLKDKSLSLNATLKKNVAYQDAEIIIIATPTDFDPINNYFNTDSVDMVVKDILNFNDNALIVIKSTLPVGHTKALQDKYSTDRIIFSPEFLREGRALEDNLYPSRIIIGGSCKLSHKFSNILQSSSLKDSVKILFMTSTEAEAVKLFSNSYLAMRVGFFNELDSLSLSKNMNSKNVIEGVCLDDRIGNIYNNPSFGYGGYCLPKDTKQLLATYDDVPQNLINAIVSSNDTRINFLATEILKKNPKIVGIYRLIMKEGSDNFRSSSIQGIMDILNKNNIKIIIYEPTLTCEDYLENKIVNNLRSFKSLADIILTNRKHDDLEDSSYKVFTRDIFGDN